MLLAHLFWGVGVFDTAHGNAALPAITGGGLSCLVGMAVH
jgi:hypothetical protein